MTVDKGSSFEDGIKKFSIDFYSEKVLAELLEFPVSIRARCFLLLDRMKSDGPNLGFPYTRKIVGTEAIFEVRGKAKEGIGRVLYCTVIGNKIIVLHAFVKKTQKTPKKDIDLAVSRYKELRNEILS